MNVQVMASNEVASGFDGWLGTGKQLLAERNAIDWKLADWIAEGRTSFGNQAAFDFLADELGIEPKALKTAAKVAVAFPPALRDASLTFGHYESVAALERTEALALLKRAKAEPLDNRETRMAAVRRQTEIAERTLFARDRTDDDYQRICRAWNRADMDARRLFLEQIEETQMEDIDA